jgi:hypothetical protein
VDAVPSQPLVRSLLSQYQTPIPSSQKKSVFSGLADQRVTSHTDRPAYFGLTMLLRWSTLSAVDN